MRLRDGSQNKLRIKNTTACIDKYCSCSIVVADALREFDNFRDRLAENMKFIGKTTTYVCNNFIILCVRMYNVILQLLTTTTGPSKCENFSSRVKYIPTHTALTARHRQRQYHHHHRRRHRRQRYYLNLCVYIYKYWRVMRGTEFFVVACIQRTLCTHTHTLTSYLKWLFPNE